MKLMPYQHNIFSLDVNAEISKTKLVESAEYSVNVYRVFWQGETLFVRVGNQNHAQGKRSHEYRVAVARGG